MSAEALMVAMGADGRELPGGADGPEYFLVEGPKIHEVDVLAQVFDVLFHGLPDSVLDVAGALKGGMSVDMDVLLLPFFLSDAFGVDAEPVANRLLQIGRD